MEFKLRETYLFKQKKIKPVPRLQNLRRFSHYAAHFSLSTLYKPPAVGCRKKYQLLDHKHKHWLGSLTQYINILRVHLFFLRFMEIRIAVVRVQSE